MGKRIITHNEGWKCLIRLQNRPLKIDYTLSNSKLLGANIYPREVNKRALLKFDNMETNHRSDIGIKSLKTFINYS